MTRPRHPNSATPGDIYSEISQLRQAQDFNWLIGLLPTNRTRRFADLCCGTGLLMQKMLEQNRVSELAVGVDHCQSMISAARKNLSSLTADGAPKVKLVRLALDKGPRLDAKFDLITMTSALHWLYPNEASVFRWVLSHLTKDGFFCFTTYHPTTLRGGYGGTDMLVRHALGKMRLERDFKCNQTPMGSRTRSVKAIRDILRGVLVVERTQRRMTIMRVQSWQQYVTYHLATFGSYYTMLVEPSRREEFLWQLGQAAVRRSETYGYVTKMVVAAHVTRVERTRSGIRHEPCCEQFLSGDA